jgi:hypothetical protein
VAGSIASIVRISGKAFRTRSNLSCRSSINTKSLSFKFNSSRMAAMLPALGFQLICGATKSSA